ncbi:MAG: LysR family transcriptional regulator [Sphingomonadaceae bacterium]|nr:LysR family transcriptional regulator [Sphingomonadaceae bacterium]
MIKRTHIRQFLSVVDAGSFTQAAVRIRVTQPTLSAGIAELERLVGSKLFVRNRRRIRLTEAGGKFLPIARALERNFMAADSFAQAQPADWPELKLGVLRSIAAPMLERVMGALVGQFSLELVDGSEGELRAAFSSGRINAALTLLREIEPGDVLLLEERYTMFVATNHPLAGRKQVEPEELASETMIARRNCELLEETSRFFTRQRVRPRFSLRSADDARCMRMVAAGVGITTAPLSFLAEGTVALDVAGYDYSRRVGLRVAPEWQGDTDRLRGIVEGLGGTLG